MPGLVQPQRILKLDKYCQVVHLLIQEGLLSVTSESMCMNRALDHPILGPKFDPIPNAKKYGFFPRSDKKSQFDRKKIFFFLGSPSLFHRIQIQNILLHIYNSPINRVQSHLLLYLPFLIGH